MLYLLTREGKTDHPDLFCLRWAKTGENARIILFWPSSRRRFGILAAIIKPALNAAGLIAAEKIARNFPLAV